MLSLGLYRNTRATERNWLGTEVGGGLTDAITSSVIAALLSDLVDGGLDVEQGMLFVIDGSKALRKVVRRSSTTRGNLVIGRFHN